VVAKKSACNSNRAAEDNGPKVPLHGKSFHSKGTSPFGLAQGATTSARAGNKENRKWGLIKSTSSAPYTSRIGEPKLNTSKSQDNQKFKVRCHSGNSVHHELASDSVLLQIEQRIRREGREEMWVSLQVKCNEKEDGTLAVQVVLCNPDWDEPLRIASIQSNPKNGTAADPVLKCDLEKKEF